MNVIEQRGSVLFVGTGAVGTTSKARMQALDRQLPGHKLFCVDTGIPLAGAKRLWRSVAFRWRVGPAVADVNKAVRVAAARKTYDAIWVDKGTLLTPGTVDTLRQATGLLVHYTPDTAFYGNRSRYFDQSLQRYDLVVTTKSFEIEHYLRHLPRERVLLTTQGYDAAVHYPRCAYEQKGDAVCFIGLCEPAREHAVRALLSTGVRVTVGGKKWGPFLRTQRGCPRLSFLGEGVWHDDYAQKLSSARMVLGLLSKRFPELHTTRTFEAPACGTALVTEMNRETSAFFAQDEAIFFTDATGLVKAVLRYLADPPALRRLSEAGHQRVIAGGYSYDAIVGSILQKVGLVSPKE